MKSLLLDSLGLSVASVAVTVAIAVVGLLAGHSSLTTADLNGLWRPALGIFAISAAVVMVGGIPTLIILRHFRLQGILHFCAGGFLAAGAICAAVEMAGDQFPHFDGSASAWARVAGIALSTGCLGLVAGATFWAVSGRAPRSN